MGVVDLPIQRERHTGWPVVSGSALKGVLRDACREKARSVGPIQGADPAEIEAKFPKSGELEASVPTCEVEGCQREVFRWQKRCKLHHLEWIKSRDLENEEHQKKMAKAQKAKDYPEKQAKLDCLLSSSYCANCLEFVEYKNKRVVLKSEDVRPKKPYLARSKYKMICAACNGE